MNKTLTLDWNKYTEKAIEAVAEGCVLLENNGVLPLAVRTRVSVFGRMQLHYYKSGTGSGGMVNISKLTGITDALRENKRIIVNESLLSVYRKWDENHPVDEGEGWGSEPWNQEEMPLTEELVAEAAEVSDVAIIIIARTAGEDKDALNTRGSYMLTDVEEDMIKKVRQGFKKVVVLLNTGGIIDLSFIDSYKPDAVMLVWQGGMIGGTGTVRLLTGEATPSGHLTDTICYEVSDQYSDKNFGEPIRIFYEEDIYVGYRYFETFAKDRVRYPFGYGLSYTSFKLSRLEMKLELEHRYVSLMVNVKNVGSRCGKNVTQIYVEAPQGRLGKPARVLVGFAKTRKLNPDEEEILYIDVPFMQMASYDDSGVTGHKSCFVMEEGEYKLYYGEDVRNAECLGTFKLDELMVLEQLGHALAPVRPFKRIKPVCVDGEFSITKEEAPTLEYSEEYRIKENMPSQLVKNRRGTFKLVDVYRGEVSVEEFVAQLSDEELASIVRGEGMGSSRVTPGTAAAFGGVSRALVERWGIPAVCCDDGPSGMRLDCGMKAFSLPNGTLLGCTFNRKIVEELYAFTGMEMISKNVDCLLGPGMNIHRHTLNGRNFEYFSEDPYLTGCMAGAMLKGLRKHGADGTAKHFCGNNQEYRRHFCDSVISERALREIYLKGFEMIVKEGVVDSIMTTYGSVNGLWTAGNYDLNTEILRNQWGYKGILMTDWWANINERDKEPDKTNFAAMVRAQNDLYMVCPDGETNASGDNTLEALADGRINRSELQRSAANICRYVLRTPAFKRFIGEEIKIEIINRPADEDDEDFTNAEFMVMDKGMVIDLTDKDSVRGCNYLIPFDLVTQGVYEITLVGSSILSELAQLPCTLFLQGYPLMSFTFHGTEGEECSIKREAKFLQRFTILRLNVGANGLKLKEIRFKYIRDVREDELGF